jgi:U4/U6 small nuclear ribonucleoprotein PRP4
VLDGHEDIVNYVDFHPLGKHIASTSNDKTWRFWDLEYKKEILTQEGHAGEVYPMSFYKDGSLIATGDFHGVGLVWDLRSGQNIQALSGGHIKKIVSLKFLPNCY